jgi:hypothetical protein
VTDTPTSSRRSRWTVPILAAVGVLAALVVGILVARTHKDQSGYPASALLPPASPGVLTAGYVGSRWRLTTVSDRDRTTAIPSSVDAWLELASNGELLASNDVNVTNAHFITTSTGFDVSDPVTSAVGYIGNDPAQVAATIGINAMTSQVMSSAASSLPQTQPVRVTVLSADRTHLTIQAGGVRLTFVRNGPVRTFPPPVISSAPGR